MFELARPDDIYQFGAFAPQGLHMTLVQGHVPVLVAITSDYRGVEWEDLNTTLHIMHLNSVVTPSPIDYSVFVMFYTYWQNALPGAEHFCLTGFFDFFDEDTARWIRKAIFHTSFLIFTFCGGDYSYSTQVLDYQNLIPFYQRYMDDGIAAAAYLKQKRLLENPQAPFPPDFTKTREYLFRTWPDDPFTAYALRK